MQALNSIACLLRSYFSDELLTLSPSSSALVDETGSGTLGSIKKVIEPVVSRLAVHILRGGFFKMTEIIFESKNADLFMLPIYVLKVA